MFACPTLALAMLLAGCHKNDDSKAQGKGKKGGEATLVKTIKTETHVLPKVVDVVAILAGRKQADVTSRVAGKVSFIGPAEGQKVREGELLFRVDRSDPGESFVPTPVTSPISGWVGRWLVTSVGSPVNALEPVVTIVDDEVLRTTVSLPTGEWLEVKTSTPVRLTVGGETRKARIAGIARSAEAASSRGAVTVEIDNASHTWKAGMLANVAFDLTPKPRMTVPAAAISLTDQGSFAYVVEDGKAKRVRVKFDVLSNDVVEITDGVSVGAELVVDGVNQVSDGLPVKASAYKGERSS